MKKNIFTLALIICASTMDLMSDNISSAKREFSATQKELSTIISKRDKAQQKQEQLQADYIETLAQIEVHKEKPKSLQYKNAVKKSESLCKKIEQNASEIDFLNQEISSLTQVVAEREVALRNAERAKEDERIAKQLAKDSVKVTKKPAKEQNICPSEQEYPAEPQVENNTYTLEDNNSNSTSQSLSNQTSSENNELYSILFYICIFIFVAIFGWFDYKKKHHCPKCGKWFTLESEGDTRVWDHDNKGKISRRGARKKYRCKNCGHQVQFIEWFKK